MKEKDYPARLSYDEANHPFLTLNKASVKVIAGPGQGLVQELTLDPLVIGSGQQCDFSIPDHRVSRKHVELRVHSAGYLLRDLDSTNGTFYHGARVQDVLLGLDAEVHLGESVIRIEAADNSVYELQPRPTFGNLIGEGVQMQKIFGLLNALAPTEATLLLDGEPGTGKECIAEAIHKNSSRAKKKILVLDCGAVPPSRIESELFGHRRGSFNGAMRDRKGIFEQANGGTVFIDEVGILSLPLQMKLLRALDQRSIKRYGEETRREVDVRVIVATHRNLAQMVEEGSFRRDLYERLELLRLRVPPLRERIEDLPALASAIIKEAGDHNPRDFLSDAVLGVLKARKWPGNIRQLRSVIERAMALRDGGAPVFKAPKSNRDPDIRRSLPEMSLQSSSEFYLDGDWLEIAIPDSELERPLEEAKLSLIAQFERVYLQKLVDRYGYNITHLAEGASVSRHEIRTLLKKHGLSG